MVGSIYKVLAKVLSRRLKDVISYLNGEVQTALVRGRQILDGALIADQNSELADQKGQESSGPP